MGDPPMGEGRVKAAIVDDDVTFLDMTRAILSSEGDIDVVTFHDPMDALEAIVGQGFHIVVSDLEMPGLDGLSLMKGLRDRGDDVPFIVLTGRSREEVAIEALNAGVDAYLQKGRNASMLFAELRHVILRIVGERRQREALKDDLHRQRMAFESTMDGVFEVDLVSKSVMVSESMSSLLFVPGETLPRDLDDWVALLHPEDLLPAREEAMTQLPHGRMDIDGRLMARGTYRWFRIRVTVIDRDDDGPVTRLVGTISDDHDRRVEHDESARTRRLIDRMLDTVPDMMSIHDRDFGILYCNWNGFAEVDEDRRCIGDKCYHALRDLDSICPDCRARSVIETGVPCKETVEVGEGHVLEINILPLFDERGEVEMFVEYVRDVTAHMSMEGEVREAHRMYESLLRHSDEGIMLIDRTGAIIDCNETALAMLDIDDPSSMDIFSLHPMATKADITDHIDRIMEEGRFVLDERYTRPDGKAIDIQVSLSIADRSKGMVHCMIRDMTESHMMERSLRQANEKLNLLSSITRHDVLNQTSVLEGYLDLMGDAEEGEREMMLARAKRALRTIDRQIEFTREYHDMGVKSPEWQGVERIVVDAWAGIGHGGATLEYDVDGLELFADPMLPKVFLNIMQNAITHGGSVRLVSLSFETSSEGGTIIIRDDGGGVPLEDKERIFHRAFGSGTGFGLFLTREILRITGIGIEETGVPGEGAEFRLHVPTDALRIHKS